VLAATVRALFRTYPGLHGEPGATLTTAGRLLHDLIPADLFMTGVYVVFDKGGRVGWTSAGHLPPLRVSPAGRVAPVDLSPVGLPLGIDPDEEYRTVWWELAPGERFVLFTDGLVEACDAGGEEFGRHRLATELAGCASLSIAEMVHEVVSRAAEHHGRGDFEDDFTILGVGRSVE
jgi:sigma-B regulation protein RsbU (phosphoserine phosphatase)